MLLGGGDPYPGDGPMPHLEAWQLCRDFHWTYQQYIETPIDVLEVFALYNAVRSGVEAIPADQR
jgi:hypothetical protein